MYIYIYIIAEIKSKISNSMYLYACVYVCVSPCRMHRVFKERIHDFMEEFVAREVHCVCVFVWNSGILKHYVLYNLCTSCIPIQRLIRACLCY